jgi:hypothetical protein
MTPHDTRDPLLPPARHIEPLFSVGEVREVVENIYHGEDFPQLVGTTSRGRNPRNMGRTERRVCRHLLGARGDGP